MKNLKLHEIVIAAIICILICLLFAIIGRDIIGISGDFLAAGTTLFASFIAYLIFIDWREEYQIKKLEEFHNQILNESHLLESAFKKIDPLLRTGNVVNSFDKAALQDDEVDANFADNYEDVCLHLRKLHRLLSEYGIFLKHFRHKSAIGHAGKVEDLRKKVFILVMVSRKNKGIASSKPLKEFTTNILVKKHKLDTLVYDLNSFAYENTTTFFYKVFNK